MIGEIVAETGQFRLAAARASRSGVLWLLFFGTILCAWIVLALMASEFPGYGVMHLTAPTLWEALCLSAAEANPLALWGMWALMSLAMMTPTFVPTLRVYADLATCNVADARGMVALCAGYLVIWLGFSGAAALVQTALARAELVGPDGTSRSLWLTTGLLLGAGAYQFSQFRDACLSKCRMPLTFFLERWTPGAGAALRMGLELGGVCLACCWALMLLGFVGGTMNLIWMGLATLFMTLEKLPQIGAALTRPMGWLLIGASVVTGLLALGIL